MNPPKSTAVLPRGWCGVGDCSMVSSGRAVYASKVERVSSEWSLVAKAVFFNTLVRF
jgi:hypothetical protein